MSRSNRLCGVRAAGSAAWCERPGEPLRAPTVACQAPLLEATLRPLGGGEQASVKIGREHARLRAKLNKVIPKTTRDDHAEEEDSQ